MASRLLTTDLGRALEVAESAVLEAGSLLRRDFQRPEGPRGSGDKAEADVEAEKAIRGRLARAFPAWSYLGEETGAARGEEGAPVWLVDPNDGTRDYLRGRRGSAVSIGLVHDGRPVLGVVYAFAYPDDGGDLFVWAEGCGPLRRNGRTVEHRVPDALASTDVVLLSSRGDRDPGGNLECAAPARYRTVPSIAHRLALVAVGEGAAATSLYAPGAWDYAGGQALLRASGGTLVDEEGRPIAYTREGRSQTKRAFGGSAAVAGSLRQRSWDVGEGRPSHPFARRKRGQTVNDTALLSRAQGCLLGQLAGDSLGALVEFRSAVEVAERYPDGPRQLEDGGQWGILAGQPTDDSEMALALARQTLAAGRYDAGAALEGYRAWLRSGPFDVGGTVRAALADRPNPASQANGSLMRASPLAVFAHAESIERAAETAREDSRLTHPHPVCGDAVAAFVVAVRHALREGDGPEPAWRAARAWAKSANAAFTVQETLEKAAQFPPVCDGEHQGFVLVALQNAFHELLHAGSLEEGVVRTVRRGGDSDTNAAVAGALLGSVHGREAVPAQWRRMILSCRPHPRVAERPRPMDYWPVDVYELAECLLLAGVR
jgi:ADP-ribosylglycohydrolase/fructose-1,6-bisphosphatase/inositol monophosphatase family enzyme